MQYMHMQFTVNKSFMLQLYALSKHSAVDKEVRLLTTIGLSIVQYTVYSTVQYSTVHYSTVQYSTVQYIL